MKIGRLLTLGLGVGIGFVLGSRSGRDSYERMKDEARRIWEDPKVQSTIHDVTDNVREHAPEAVNKVVDTVTDLTGRDGNDKDNATPNHKPDVVSDPELGGSEAASDWASEGGAPSPRRSN
ncbi:hypothetical protein [Micrococcoides hystricis]|uniref:YtxH domain-containing protein n=1 Tax=Micrococcoides hystricis TaxID=1572761 RepID=A0ABV6PC38_9MICC